MNRATLFAAIIGLLLICNSRSQAQERYIFLGDSLVDNQNSFIGTTLITPNNIVPATPPYYLGRFSNGPNWTDRLAPNQVYFMDYYFSNPDCVAENTSKGIASLCGSTTDPGAQDGVSMNFAFGGARSGNEDLPTLATSLQTALDLFRRVWRKLMLLARNARSF